MGIILEMRYFLGLEPRRVVLTPDYTFGLVEGARIDPYHHVLLGSEHAYCRPYDLRLEEPRATGMYPID